MESISPNMFVNDISKTVDYYKQLGFEIRARVPDEGDFVWVMLTCGKVTVMFQTFDSLQAELPAVKRVDGGSLLLYIQSKEIRKFYEQIKDKVNVIKGLEKTFYGATEFSILDINNYVLTFAEHE
ncbi:MAG: VOC family protein [bacterium]|nr:VOC family protein [bacterium]